MKNTNTGVLIKKSAALLSAIIILLAACGQNGTQSILNNGAGVTPSNESIPVNSAFSGLGFSFILPQEYGDVKYSVIDNSIAEAVFRKDGKQYTFRMAEGERDTTDVEIKPSKKTNTQGVYLAGNIAINYNPGEPGLAEWKDGSFSYSLYTDNCDGDLMRNVLFGLMKDIQKQVNPLSNNKAYMKLWDADIGQAGYIRTDASYMRSWKSEGCGMMFTVCPESYKPVPNETKKISFGGRDFYTSDQAVCWDGADENQKWIGGTTYTRDIVWYGGGCAYSLSANTSDKNVSLDIVSPETALALEKSDSYRPEGFEQTSECWSAEFRSGVLTVSIWVTPKPFGSKIFSEIIKEASYKLQSKNGFEYYERYPDRKPEDPNVKSLLWGTNAGLVQFNGGIPYGNRNDFSADVWDFINADLAMSITEQIGCTPEKLPEQ